MNFFASKPTKFRSKKIGGGDPILRDMKTHLSAWENKKVIELFEKIERTPALQIQHCNLALKALNMLSRHEDAVNLYQQRVVGKKLTPTSETLCQLMHALSKNLKYSEALEVFEHLVRKGLIPDSRVVLQAIVSCEKGENAQKGLSLLRDAMSIPGFKLHSEHYNTVLRTWIRDKNVNISTIVELFKEMLQYGLVPDQISFKCMLKAFVRKGTLQQAISFWKQAEENGFVPDDHAFHMLLESCQKHQNAEHIKEIIDLMKQKGAKPKFFREAISAYKNCPDLALELYKSMQEEELSPGLVLFNKIMKKTIECGKYAAALKMFDEMHTQGLKPSTFTLNQALTAMTKLYGSRAALNSASKTNLQALGLNLNKFNYSRLLKHVSTLHPEEMLTEVENMFLRMSEENIEKDVHIYTSAIYTCGQAKNGHILASKLYLQMKEEGILPDIFFFRSLAKACINDLEQVLKVIEDSKAAGFEPDLALFKALISAYCEEDNINKALETLKSAEQVLRISEYDSKMELYNTALAGFVKAGRLDKALEFVAKDMHQEQLEPDAVSITCLMSGFTRQGQGGSAIKLFENSVQNGVQIDHVAGNAAISACRSIGDWRKALEIFGFLESKQLHKTRDNYSVVLVTLDEQNQIDLAKQFYRQALREGLFPQLFQENSALCMDFHKICIPVAKAAVRCIIEDIANQDCSIPNSGLLFNVGTPTNPENSVKASISKVIEEEFHLETIEIPERPGWIGISSEVLKKIEESHC